MSAIGLHRLGLIIAARVSSKELENVSRFPHLFAELVRPGSYERDIAKVTSGNMLCALRQVEAIGGQLRKAPDIG